MKKLAFIIGLLLFCGQVVFADGTQPEQTAQDNKAVISIQKQPTTENSQKQKVTRNIGCIIIMVNGKVKE